MSTFTDPIKLVFNNPNKPTICSPIEGWRYYLDWENAAEYVTVYRDLETDGLSSPTRLRGILPKFDYRSLKAAITHDSIYKNPVIYLTDVEGATRKCSKMEADKLFFRMLKLGGQGWIDEALNHSDKAADEYMQDGIGFVKFLLLGYYSDALGLVYLYRKHSWKARCLVAYMALFLFGWVAWYKHRFNDWRNK